MAKTTPHMLSAVSLLAGCARADGPRSSPLGVLRCWARTDPVHTERKLAGWTMHGQGCDRRAFK